MKSQSQGHEANRRTVFALKRTANAAGRPMSYEEIGATMDMSAQAAHFYVGHIHGLCPGCLRKLERLPTLSKTTKRPKKLHEHNSTN